MAKGPFVLINPGIKVAVLSYVYMKEGVFRSLALLFSYAPKPRRSRI